jgi:type III restriction enzyme
MGTRPVAIENPVPAVNNHGEFGRWAFREIRDPRDAKNEIRTALTEKNV